jgi:hypothetical protein
MAAITWRNIDIGNQGGANALLANSADDITRGLDVLANVAAQQGQTQSANWDQVSKNNTNDLLAKLNSFTSTDALAKEIEGGEFNLDKMDSAFGRQYNKAAVADAISKKRDSLLAIDKANKLAAEAELNKKVTLEKAKRIKQFDANAMELVSQFTDPNELSARLFSLGRRVNPDGLIPGTELGGMIDQYVNRVKGVGLDEASSAVIKMQQDRVPGIITEGTTAVDKALQDFKTKGGYDESMDKILADPMTVADAMNKLRTQITEKGTVPNTVAIANVIQQMNDKFTSEGLPAPTGRLLYELVTQGGHSDDDWWIDPNFKLNTDFMDNAIQKIKTNQIFKENNAEQLAEFARAKADITDGTSLAVLNNQQELLRANRAKAFKTEAHTPELIQLDSVQERNRMLVDQLKSLKPAGVITETIDTKDTDVRSTKKNERDLVDTLNQYMPKPPPR